MFTRLAISERFSRLMFMARNNPDYFGAVLTGYLFLSLNIGLQVLLVPLYIHKLGYAEFGVLMILLSFVNFSTVGVYGFAGSVVRALSEHAAAGDMKAFVAAYSAARALLAFYGIILIVAASAVVTLGWVSEHDAPDAQTSGIDSTHIVVAAYLLVLFELSLNRLALSAKGFQTAGNIVQIIHYAVFGLSVVPLLLLGGGLNGVIGCLIVGAACGRIYSWIYWRRAGLPQIPLFPGGHVVRAAFARFFNRTSGAYVLYTGISFLMQADVLIIGWFAGATAAASFVLVWKIAEVLLVALGRFPDHLQMEFIAMDAQGNLERLSRVYRKALIGTRLLSLTVGIGYALFGHWIVSLWVGQAAVPAAPWAYWLAGAAILWLGSARMPAIVAYARVRMRALLLVSGSEVAVKLVLLAALFPYVHFVAPVVAINIVHACGFAYIYDRLGRASISR
jgi:O-antigen/teichoic acid export membrane protein